MTLISWNSFISHSKIPLKFKLECDSLLDSDLDSLAKIIAHEIPFSKVHGVPRGGLRLANALKPYTNPTLRSILIVDDVLTTGKSMEDMKNQIFIDNGKRISSGEKIPSLINHFIYGAVIFARGPCPEWIRPIFILNPIFGP